MINTNIVCVCVCVCVCGGGQCCFFPFNISLTTLPILRQATVLKGFSFDFLKHTQRLVRIWKRIALCLCVCEACYVVDASIFSVGAIQKRSYLNPVKSKIVVGHT